MQRRGLRRVVLALALLLSLTGLVQVNHRATRGRNALLKWGPAIEALEQGEPIYGVGAEGYPTLPLSLLLLSPFHALGSRVGPLAFALLEVSIAWWIVTRALALAAGRARDFPPLGQLAVLLLSFRVLLSDLLHGNINLLVGGCVATAAWDWSRRREARAGAWLGLGAVLKVTPALGLLFLAWKGSARGLLGALGGMVGAALLLPGLLLGWERNLALAGDWWRQMVAPYLEGRPLTLLQTEQTNQSLLGVLGRLCTDSVAVVARPPHFPEELRVNLLALGPSAFRALHLAACALVLGWLLWCLRRRPRIGLGHATLGEFSLLALAMLFLSERSWKHHYVLIAFPIAFLVWQLASHSPRARSGLEALAALGLTALLQAGSGSAFLGARGSDLAEAYGVQLLAGITLFVAVGRELRRERAAGLNAGSGASPS